jgi:hypothetical protein
MNLNVLQNLLTPTQGVKQRHAVHTKTPGKIILSGGHLGGFCTGRRLEKIAGGGGGTRSFSYSCSDEVSSPSGNTSYISRITCEPRSPPCAAPLRVHFNAAVSLRLIPCINEYSRKEIERTWYLPEESFKVHESCIKEILMLERGKKMKGKKYCSRGLENSTKQAQLARKQNQRDAYDAVLDEQDEQHEHDNYDDDAIAEMYHGASNSCQMWAHVVGMRDRREAVLIYDEDE